MGIPQIYVDELITSDWVQWSEGVFHELPDPMFATPTGFQQKSGAAGSSNNRTRAGELYNLGLLVGPLVNASEGGSGGMPLGWARVCANESVQSTLGYIAYALGHAANSKEASPSIASSFSVLCAVFCLQLSCPGVAPETLLASLFQYLLKNFPKPLGVKEAKWNRLVAAVLFCTLEEEGATLALVRDYKADVSPQDLILVNDTKRIEKVSPTVLLAEMEKGFGLTNLKPMKPSLYWIGAPEAATPRGIYSQAISNNHGLLAAAARIERNAIAAGKVSPFEAVWAKQHNVLLPDVLDTCAAVFTANGEQSIWSNAMETLRRGVLNAIRHIDGGSGVCEPQVLYLHGASTSTKGFESAQVEVPEASCVSKVSKGDLVIVDGQTTEVLSVTRAAGKVTLALKPI